MPTNISKYLKSGNDELYTPKILVEAIKPFFEDWLAKFNGVPTVWCPFDLEKSEFVFLFKEYEKQGRIKLVYSHITDPDGKGDFFERIQSQEFDIAVSNPPFTRKLDVFKLLNEKGKTWVMVTNTEALNYQEIGNYFADNPVGLIIPDKKVSFNGGATSFNSSFFCSESFYTGVTFVHIDNNNTRKYFVPSRMIEELDNVLAAFNGIKNHEKKNKGFDFGKH